jgi:formate hydrogenlyase subunit 6/NADH:ubiquinone oxidoreductase subunit I
MPYFITDACIGCTMCAKNCPVGAIKGKSKERHIVNSRRCVDCGVCGKVCPKSALVDGKGMIVKKVPRDQWLKPSVDSNACSACSMCVDICTFNCLKITYPKFKGDLKVYASLEKSKDCVGCGLCAGICPLNVIKMEVVTSNG